MRPLNERQKTALAFASGVGIVVATVAWQTGGEPLAIILTLGFPMFFYGIWSTHQLRKRRQRIMQAALENSLHVIHKRRETNAKRKVRELDILFGKNANDNPLAYVPTPQRGERRVLLPRDHEVTKQRILQGRELMLDESEVDLNDQWHS